MGKLTNHKIFEREQGRDYRQLIPGAHDGPPIQLHRHSDGRATASIYQRFVVHSPDGFEWGYGGSGPADLALNILGLFLPAPEAWRLHQNFKFEVIAALESGSSHTIELADVISWIQAHWRAHPVQEEVAR